MTAAPQPLSVRAVASLILGTFSLLGGYVPVFILHLMKTEVNFILGLILMCLMLVAPVVGIFLGHVGHSEVVHDDHRGHWAAIAGLIVNYTCIATLLSIIGISTVAHLA